MVKPSRSLANWGAQSQLLPTGSPGTLSPNIEHVNDLPPRLEMLRFLERVQLKDLERTRRWIAAEEQREQERQRGQAARPPEPEWLLQQSLGARHPVAVHVGGCHMAGKYVRPLARDQAVRALTDGIEACSHCRPDTELGVMD